MALTRHYRVAYFLVELSTARYARDVVAAETLLELAPAGTYVIMYDGFGGRIPNSCEQLQVERELPAVWRKLHPRHSGYRVLLDGN